MSDDDNECDDEDDMLQTGAQDNQLLPGDGHRPQPLHLSWHCVWREARFCQDHSPCFHMATAQVCWYAFNVYWQ